MRLLIFFFLLFGLVVAILLHMSFARTPMPRGRHVEIILLHMLFWGVGLIVTTAALRQLFGPDSILWRMGEELSPEAQKAFQLPIGFAGLSLGILGLLCAYFRAGFWVATIVFALIFNICLTIMTFLQGVSVDVEIVTLLWDILAPVLLLVFLILFRLRAGPDRFWKPTPFTHKNNTEEPPQPPPRSGTP